MTGRTKLFQKVGTAIFFPAMLLAGFDFRPQLASFLLTLVTTTIVIQITWPRLTETNSR
jgi:hypothetical protein